MGWNKGVDFNGTKITSWSFDQAQQARNNGGGGYDIYHGGDQSPRGYLLKRPTGNTWFFRDSKGQEGEFEFDYSKLRGMANNEFETVGGGSASTTPAGAPPSLDANAPLGPDGKPIPPKTTTTQDTTKIGQSAKKTITSLDEVSTLLGEK